MIWNGIAEFAFPMDLVIVWTCRLVFPPLISGEGGSCGTHETGGVKKAALQSVFGLLLTISRNCLLEICRVNPHPTACAPTLPQIWGREKRARLLYALGFPARGGKWHTEGCFNPQPPPCGEVERCQRQGSGGGSTVKTLPNKKVAESITPTRIDFGAALPLRPPHKGEVKNNNRSHQMQLFISGAIH